MESRPQDEPDSRGYDKEIIDRVWHFGRKVPGNDCELWRKDEFGAWMHKLDYGNRHSQFGWEIGDFSLGHSDAGIARHRPLQWQNYVDQAAAHTESCITADGLRNIRELL